MILGLVIVGVQVLILDLDFGFNCFKFKKNQNWQSEYPKNQLENHQPKPAKKKKKNWTTLVHTHDPYNILTIIDTTSLMCENGIHLDTHTKHMHNIIFLQTKLKILSFFLCSKGSS